MRHRKLFLLFPLSQVLCGKQYNGKEKNKGINNNGLENTKDQAPRTLPKCEGELRCPRRVSCSCSTSDVRRVTVKRQNYHLPRYILPISSFADRFCQFVWVLLFFLKT